MSRRVIGPLATAATLLALAASAAADPVTIDGDPLNVTVNEYGNLQARFDGRESGEFYPPGGEVGNAGFHLAIFDAAGEATLYGTTGSTFSSVDADANGEPDGPTVVPPAPGDPTKRLAVTYTAGDLRVDQLIEYRDGDREFTTHQAVTNTGRESVRFSAAEFADLYLTGSDLGTGFFDPGPPRVVGGISQTASSGGGIVEMPPSWSAYEVNNLGTVTSHLGATNGPELDGTIVKEVVDNAVAVQWDQHKAAPLEPNGRTTFSVRWRFGDFEVPPPPPVAGENVNVDPIGVVRVKYPPGTGPPAPAGEARAAQSGFVLLTRPAQIPVGSIVDVRRGGVEMTSAANLTGKVQTGTFRSGTFRVSQRPTRRPITDLALRGGSFRACRRDLRRSSARTAARRIRRLRGSGRGRFRTRGRYGSATVRGTEWSITDQCNGTLTRVTEGRVAVRDFAKRRTIVLRAGRSYLARPRR